MRLKWKLVLVHLEIVLVLVQQFVQNKARNSFLTHPTELLGNEAQVESCYGPFGDSVSISAR